MNQPIDANFVQQAFVQQALDRVLSTISADVRRCVVCSIPHGARARFEPVNAVTVHYVVAGTGFFQIGNQPTLKLGPEGIVVAPARTLQFWATDEDAGEDTQGRERCAAVDDRLARLLTRGQSEEALSIVRSEIYIGGTGAADFFENLRQPIIEGFAEDDLARQVFELMIAELAEPTLGSRAVGESLIKTFLILVLRRHFGA